MIANALARRNGGGVPVTLPAASSLGVTFIVKYGLSGVAQWATTLAGSRATIGYGLGLDSTGVYVTGSYSNLNTPASLGNGVTLPVSALLDVFTAKYDKNGVAQWASVISGTGSDSGYGLAVDSTGVYVTGLYSNATSASLGNGVTLPTSVGNDTFIAKYDVSGVAQWASVIGGTGSDSGYGLAVDSTGVYVTGQYSNTTSLSLGNGVTLPTSISNDTFIAKYDVSGVAQWATAISGTGTDTGRGIAVDSTGVYVTGQYSNTTSNVSLGNGVTLPTSISNDAFTVKYDLSGVAQWATAISASGTADSGRGIAVDSTGVYVIGSYAASSGVTL